MPLEYSQDTSLPGAVRYVSLTRHVQLQCMMCSTWICSNTENYNTAMASFFAPHAGSPTFQDTREWLQGRACTDADARSQPLFMPGLPALVSGYQPPPFPRTLLTPLESNVHPHHEPYYILPAPAMPLFESAACGGIPLNWPGNYFVDYPLHWHMHDDNPSSEFRLPWRRGDRIDGVEYIRAHNCTPLKAVNGVCAACFRLPATVTAIYAKIRKYDPDSSIDDEYLARDQLQERVTRLRGQAKKLKLEVKIFDLCISLFLNDYQSLNVHRSLDMACLSP
jgi:hypothetical protein